jgi:hypothetical protein
MLFFLITRTQGSIVIETMNSPLELGALIATCLILHQNLPKDKYIILPKEAYEWNFPKIQAAPYPFLQNISTSLSF